MMAGVAYLMSVILVVTFFGALPIPAAAEKPVAVKTRILTVGKNSYDVEVTVQHGDSSWEHYADRWEVIGSGGRVLGTRVLLHPHIGERWFTRKLRRVTIPAGVEHIIIRVHDKVHGYGRDRLVAMPTADKPDTGYK